MTEFTLAMAERGVGMSIFGLMDADGNGIPDNMLYYDLCMGKKIAYPTKSSQEKVHGKAKPSGKVGGNFKLRKGGPLQSGHVPGSK